jgi:CubicO group peptidase (beta-lactamase class C family)
MSRPSLDAEEPRGSTADRQVTLPDGRQLHGWVDDGYGAVMDAFRENFLARQDLGAGCTAYRDGRIVVDLWGGIADRRTGRAWGRDTAVTTFSCTKGIVAICAYLLVGEGSLDLDAPVARYWPEFAANGKQAITVRETMSHRAGLPALDVDLSKDEVVAWDPVIHAIEAQSPLFAPGAGYFYHAMTYGWLVGEVIRRITGLTPGRFFRAAVGDRLGLRTWIGLPAPERATVAWTESPLPDEDSPAALEAARVAAENPLVERSLTMGGAYAFPADGSYVTFNDPAIQAGEIPGANGISTAPSLARLYAVCVSDVAGEPLLSSASIDDALRVRSAGPSLSGAPDDGARWGTGFQLSSPPSQPMLGASSFGHAGAGGQLAFANAEHRVGFAYLSNQMGGYGDTRARELSEALRRVLRA